MSENQRSNSIFNPTSGNQRGNSVFDSTSGLPELLNFKEVVFDCPVHGQVLGKSILGRPALCAKCVNESIAKEERQADLVRHQASINAHLVEKLNKSGIPDRYWKSTLENYRIYDDKQDNVLRLIQSFASNPLGTDNLTLYGLPGTGKGHLGSAVLIKYMKEGKSVGYISFLTLIEKFNKAKSFTASESRSDILSHLANLDLLMIDEIGLIGGIKPEDSVIIAYDVINERYNLMKPTIVASNGNIEDLKMLLGERAFDRLREGNSRFLPMGWESFRKVGGSL